MKETHKVNKEKGSLKRTLLSSRLRLKKKSPSKHSITAKKKLDAQTEILRNTAINSFRVDEKPTKQLILARMEELRAREKKQKEIAACHNLMLRMRQLLPVFNEEDEGEYVEEEDEDYVEEGVDEDLDIEERDEEEDQEEDDDEEECDEDEEGEDGLVNGTVEDLDELGDEETYEQRTTVIVEESEGLE